MFTRLALGGIFLALSLAGCQPKPPDEKALAIAALRREIAAAETGLADAEDRIGITVTSIHKAVAAKTNYDREMQNYAELVRRRWDIMDTLMVLRVDLENVMQKPQP